MILMIDNYDSFTWNVVQYLYELGHEVLVKRNDEMTLGEIETLSPHQIVISPGPCTPDKAGISMDLIHRFAGLIPILGICLGHQSIGQVFGSRIVKARRVMHGKTSEIHHDGSGLFADLPSPFTATRYHSLVVDEVPDEMKLTAWTMRQGKIDEIMGISHREHPVDGVQFHPESILTEYGHELLANFINGRVTG